MVVFNSESLPETYQVHSTQLLFSVISLCRADTMDNVDQPLGLREVARSSHHKIRNICYMVNNVFLANVLSLFFLSFIEID